MKRIITLIFFLSTVFGWAQNPNEASQLFDEMAYVQAAEAYEKYMDWVEEPKLQAVKNLADAYYHLNDMTNALKWYEQLYGILGKNISNVHYMRFIQSLRSTGNYDKAYQHIKKYYHRINDPVLTERFITQKMYMDSLKTATSLFKIESLAVNSKGSDFGPAFYGDELVYSSTKDSTKFGHKLYPWNEQPYLNLYKAKRNASDGTLYEVQPFFKKINSKFHDATLSFSKDLHTVYYTTNMVRSRNTLFYDQDRTNNLRIMKGTIMNGELVNSQPIFINNSDYSVGHPSVSDDGKWLFFVSDKEGGVGETDIYVAPILEDGTIGTPKNLGAPINTPYKELFPFYSKGVLYFSSNGQYGLGGLDLFQSENIGNMSFTVPKNLGRPMNSRWDDFSFIIDSTASYGYFASNRQGGMGDDDLYYFTKAKPPCDQYITGVAIDSLTRLPLRYVAVKGYNKYGDVIASTETDDDGEYIFTLPCDGTFKVEASKPGYTSDDRMVTTTKMNHDTIAGVDFVLTNLKDLIVEEEGHEEIKVNPIYFEFDKARITDKAKVELNKVVFVLREFPDIKIKIESHADPRGSDTYNLELSDKRAKATRDYILSQDIDKERIISAIGYGESRPINECVDGVDCSDADYAVNRRSNFIIVEK